MRGPEHSTLVKCDNNTVLGFHRLAINGLTPESNQPINIGTIKLICNGEIYNYKELYKNIDVKPKTNSDCEIIIHLYKKYGIEHTLRLIDGVYAFILYDFRENETDPVIFVARDPYGVRPLYIMETSSPTTNVNAHDKEISVTHDKIICFASELKVLSALLNNKQKRLCLNISTAISLSPQFANSYNDSLLPFKIKQVEPGTYLSYECKFMANSYWKQICYPKRFFILSYSDKTSFGNIIPMKKYIVIQKYANF